MHADKTYAVAVRVRPPLRPTDPGFEIIPQRYQRSMVHNISPTSLAVESPQGRKLFVFDSVFGEDVDQEGVWEYVSDSVNSFVQGYNVSVLAYGQSGSGKSYTMGTTGPAEQSDSHMMGMSRCRWILAKHSHHRSKLLLPKFTDIYSYQALSPAQLLPSLESLQDHRY